MPAKVIVLTRLSSRKPRSGYPGPMVQHSSMLRHGRYMDPGSRFARPGRQLVCELPHRRALDVEVLQLPRHRHRIVRKAREPILRQIGAAGIADQHACPKCEVAFEEGKRASRG